MKKFVYLFVCLFAGTANATLIATDTTSITQTAQSYNSSTVLTDTSYTNVFLDITAKGDYGTFGYEHLAFYIDNILLADWTFNTPGISVSENYANYDYTLTGSVSISDALWSTFSADNNLNISWKNSSAVNPYPSQGGADYVTYSLHGDLVSVPEPATLALFGLGIAGIAFTRRKMLS